MTDPRYARKDAERAFERLCDVLGKVPGGATTHGAWVLDHSPYGGFVIEEVSEGPGLGVSHPFGDLRHPAREFVQLVAFALNALKVSNARECAR